VIDVSRALRVATDTGDVRFGLREVRRAAKAKSAKLVVLDLGAPAELRPEVRSAPGTSDHHPTGDRIVVQPRFTGALLLTRGPLPDAEAPYSTLHFTLDDGRAVTPELVRELATSELERIRSEIGDDEWFEREGRPRESRELFESVALTGEDFVEFLTLPAYERLS